MDLGCVHEYDVPARDNECMRLKLVCKHCHETTTLTQKQLEELVAKVNQSKRKRRTPTPIVGQAPAGTKPKACPHCEELFSTTDLRLHVPTCEKNPGRARMRPCPFGCGIQLGARLMRQHLPRCPQAPPKKAGKKVNPGITKKYQKAINTLSTTEQHGV